MIFAMVCNGILYGSVSSLEVTSLAVPQLGDEEPGLHRLQVQRLRLEEDRPERRADCQVAVHLFRSPLSARSADLLPALADCAAVHRVRDNARHLVHSRAHLRAVPALLQALAQRAGQQHRVVLEAVRDQVVPGLGDDDAFLLLPDPLLLRPRRDDEQDRQTHLETHQRAHRRAHAVHLQLRLRRVHVARRQVRP